MNQNQNNQYLKIEVISGAVLLAAAIFGFIISNSPAQYLYHQFLNFQIILPLHFWINEGLIAIFFFLIGLEIKSMLCQSKNNLRSTLTLPCSAAIAGVIVPALIYSIFNFHDPINMRGWAIPTAMDTAFILAAIALAGNTHNNLKFFVMALAIMDDILAVLIIALFYAEELSNTAILASVMIFGVLILLNQAQVYKTYLYVTLGIILWACVLGSGVHTSVAGVLLAATMPEKIIDSVKEKLHPWVAFGILPLFAFANANVNIANLEIKELFAPLSQGIIYGLFIGKQIGVFGITYLLVKYKRAVLPDNISWGQMYGVAILCGIGFTMSLFIGLLAFESGGPEYGNIVKAAVFIGSLISAVVGFLVLRFSGKLGSYGL